MIKMKINPEKIRDVIGKGGSVIRALTEETGTQIDIEDDGTIIIASVDMEKGREAQRRIAEITAEVEVGKVYDGTVLRLLDFGDHVAKPEILPWFAILLAVNLQTSFLTPPFGITLFYMKGVAPSIPMQALYRGIVPFVILQLIGLVAVVTFPETTLWLPRVLLD